MMRAARVDGNHAIHVCSFSDGQQYKLRYDGRVFYFDWSDRFGPCFESKDGRTINDPKASHPIWWAITLWKRQGKRVCTCGWCIWRPEPAQEDRT